MMKKTILFLTAVVFMFSMPAMVSAQFKKGDCLVEGSLGNLSIAKNKTQYEQGNTVIKLETKGFSIAVFPRVGHFITNNLVIGTTLGLSFDKSKEVYFGADAGKDQESISTLFTLDFVPFVRYYLPGKTVKTRFYGQVGAGISLDLARKYHGENFSVSGYVASSFKYNYPKKFNSVSAEALVGVNHFISQNVAVNAGLGYRYISANQTSSYTYTVGGISTTNAPEKAISKTGGVVWNVGFTMFIPGKKKK